MTEKEALIEEARQFFEELPPGEQEEMIGLTRILIDFIKKNRGKGEAMMLFDLTWSHSISLDLI